MAEKSKLESSKSSVTEDVITHVQRVESSTSDGSGAIMKTMQPEIDTSHINERKLMRKLDWVLVPWLSFLYLLSFLDRTSIGNAKLYHLERDLHIDDHQYNLALTVFFFPYAVFEVPSNLVLKKLPPRVWLSFIMFGWGIMMTVQGLIHNYGGLLGMRFMLGLFEAGFFPGVNFYLSCWYKREEFGTRAAFFFSAATASGAFGGLLAAAISKMNGIGGKPGWAWIFILEGLLTVVAGVVSYWIIQDYPNEAKFLKPAERAFVLNRLKNDSQYSVEGEKFNSRRVWQSLTDWKTWMSLLVFMTIGGPLWSFSLFLPSIINELGYTSTRANLLTVPVYALGCFVTCVVGIFGDKYSRKGGRGWINIIFLCIGVASYIILIVSRSAALSYFAVFLGSVAIFPCVPNTISWVANNVEGPLKRSVTMAMVITFGNLTGAVSSNVYRGQDKPWYTLGHGITLMYIGIALLSSIANKMLLIRENRKRDRGERDEIIRGVNEEKAMQQTSGGWFSEEHKIYESIEEAKLDKGDNWSRFRYIT